MEPNELRAALEAILFLSSEPVRVDDLAESLDETKEAIQVQLEEIKRLLDEHVGGFTVEQAAGEGTKCKPGRPRQRKGGCAHPGRRRHL